MSWLQDPEWLLARAEPPPGRFHFARVPRGLLHEAAFLDHRMPQRPTEVRRADADDVRSALGAALPRPAGWILHTAFCCSTLLARAVDVPGRTLVLREPLALNGLADRLRSGTGADDPTVNLGIRMMERQGDQGRVVVKPSNYANALGPALVRDPERRLVFLTGSLRAFLRSVLKKQTEAAGRLSVFVHATLADSDYLQRSGLTLRDNAPLLHRAAVWWHAQRHALTLWAEAAGEQVLWLGADTLLSNPSEALSGVDAHLALGLGASELEDIARGPVFAADAKTRQRFSAETRSREDAQIDASHGEAIDEARKWLAPLLERVPVTGPEAGV